MYIMLNYISELKDWKVASLNDGLKQLNQTNNKANNNALRNNHKAN